MKERFPKATIYEIINRDTKEIYKLRIIFHLKEVPLQKNLKQIF